MEQVDTESDNEAAITQIRTNSRHDIAKIINDANLDSRTQIGMFKHILW